MTRLTTADAPLGCTEQYKLGRCPGGVCPCPHFFYAFEGRIRCHWPDSDIPDEVVSAGEVCYFPAGHILIYEEASRVLELNPAAALRDCMDAMERARAERGGDQLIGLACVFAATRRLFGAPQELCCIESELAVHERAGFVPCLDDSGEFGERRRDAPVGARIDPRVHSARGAR